MSASIGDAARRYRADHRVIVEPAGLEIFFHAFGVDMAGRDAIDANALGRPFQRHGFGQAVERRLGRRIKAAAGAGRAPLMLLTLTITPGRWLAVAQRASARPQNNGPRKLMSRKREESSLLTSSKGTSAK